MNSSMLNLRKKIALVLGSVYSEENVITEDNLSKTNKLSSVDKCSEFNLNRHTAPKFANCVDELEISKKALSFKIQDLLERDMIVLDKDIIIKQI